MKSTPPKWADRFLRWYCNPELLEEIQGDVYELFDRRIDEKGSRIANRKFVWDVIRFLRWSNIRKSNSKYNTMNQFVLFRNYLKLGFRSISKHWITSSINIFGLAIAIGVTITSAIFVDMQVNMDSFHTKADRIYQVVNYVQEEHGEALWGDSPLQIGPKIVEDHPGVEATVRIEEVSASVRYGDNVFRESFIFTDPDFFEVFDFPMLYGNRQVLYDKNQIAISRDMAIKYFADQDPIGKELSIKFGNGIVKRFVVAAVMDKYPDQASFHYRFYVNIEIFFDINEDRSFGWDYLTDGTFIVTTEENDLSSLIKYFPEYVKVQNASDPEWVVNSFELVPLLELSENDYRIMSGISNGGHPAGRIALGVVSVMLLTLACFNYMNIAVSAASRRLREIAMRKVMGSVRKQIILQFMIENLIMAFLAIVFGTLISYFLFLPGFNAMIPIHVPFAFSSVPLMIGFFGALLIIIVLASGAYPSFYISRFQPISIFRGNERFGSKNIFSKVLLSFQFFFAFSTIVGSFVFTEHGIYLNEKEWGYDPSNIITLPVVNTGQFNQLKSKVEQYPDVRKVAGSFGQIGYYNRYTSFDHLGGQIQSIMYRVDESYMDIMNLELKEGRLLGDGTQDQLYSAVVNETFVNKMGWEDPIGQTFTYDSVRRNVVGVVEDFHYNDFYRDVEGVFFIGIGDYRTNYMTVLTADEKMLEVDGYVRNAWLEIAPDDPYQRRFQEDAFDGFYEENNANVSLMLVISSIAIVLACLGLYGLLSFNIQRRLKEFSVRKILGAAPISLVKIASKQYAWILLVSFVMGAPLGFVLINKLVTSIYPDSGEVGPVPFIMSILIVVITVSITISGQIIRATRVNPAENLRNE